VLPTKGPTFFHVRICPCPRVQSRPWPLEQGHGNEARGAPFLPGAPRPKTALSTAGSDLSLLSSASDAFCLLAAGTSPSPGSRCRLPAAAGAAGCRASTGLRRLEPGICSGVATTTRQLDARPRGCECAIKRRKKYETSAGTKTVHTLGRGEQRDKRAYLLWSDSNPSSTSVKGL
jgi:hypothetical protein